MQGSYDPLLVAASYGIACIAAFAALYFGHHLTDVSGKSRKFWLTVGALCMGSGIWAMHFVGMSAYTMPHDMVMSFSLGLTLLSWVPAVAASALALHMISRPKLGVAGHVVSALVMGAGICAMHYTGMAAMRMSPAISYDTTWLVISILIAVGASGAALVICRRVRYLPTKRRHQANIGVQPRYV